MSATHTERWCLASDDTKLFVQRWESSRVPTRADLLVVHGYGEHGGRYRELAHALVAAGIRTTAVDLRGHGMSEGRRGFVRRFERYLDDIACVLDELPQQHRFLLGHSNGGLAALSLVAQRSPTLTGLIVTNPYLALRMAVPRPKIWVAHAAARLVPTLALPAGLEASQLTHDEAIQAAWERDPLIVRTATAGWWLASRNAQAEVRALRTLPVPLFYIYSDTDPIALPEASATLSAQLDVQDKTVLVRPGALHEVLNEPDRASLFGAIRDWIVARCATA
ncbi:MAG: lysophospholipase [Myxococcota bacterium]